MADSYHILSGRYVDSILLMQVSRELEKLDGVTKAGCMVATKENLALFRDAGFNPPSNAEANSILIEVDAKDESTGRKAIKIALDLIERNESATAGRRSIRDVPSLIGKDDFPVLLISTAGEYVREIGLKGLDSGLNLHIFSSNVPLEDELELKLLGKEKGLLVMGPDSGIAIIDGKGLGFSNALRGGSDVAVVGSSGTGIQELTVQLDRRGVGISYAFDVGSKDLTKEVQGMMARQAIDFLEGKSRMLAIVCKRPDPRVRDEIVKLMRGRPSVFVSLGSGDSQLLGKTYVTGVIDEAVEHVLKSMGRENRTEDGPLNVHFVNSDRRLLKAYFVGGSLCYQAQAIFFKMGFPVYSNAPLSSAYETHRDFGDKNVCVDTGAEEYVAGRPHPMIDPRSRNLRLVEESRRGDVKVLLFDVILGYGSAEDPLDGLNGIDSGPAVVASICGTDRDFQGYSSIEKKLRKMGASVFNSAAKAAVYAAQLMVGNG